MSYQRGCNVRGVLAASAVDQPDDKGEGNPHTGADEYAFHWIADREAKREPRKDADREETAPGNRSSVVHRPGSGMGAAEAPALSREVDTLYN